MKTGFILFLLLCGFASAKDPDLKCKNIQEIKFDRQGTWKDRPYDWAKFGEFQVWSGEGVPHKVVNTKEKSECVLGYPNIRAIKKFKDMDLLFVDGFKDKLEYTAVIQMEDCKKIWELEINTEVTEETFNSELKVIKNDLKDTPLEKCGHCWNEKTEACRNLPVSS